MSSSYVPNPNCCTDPRHLCPRCSEAACEGAEIAANTQGHLFRRRRVDPNAVLPRPRIDWTLNQSKQSKPDCGCSSVADVPVQGLSHNLRFSQIGR